MHKLSQKGIELNRKVLADLAMNNPEAFKAIVDAVKYQNVRLLDTSHVLFVHGFFYEIYVYLNRITIYATTTHRSISLFQRANPNLQNM